MTADDYSDLKRFKQRQEALLSRQLGEDLRFAAWRTVAKQHLAQAVNIELDCFRPTYQRLREQPPVQGDFREYRTLQPHAYRFWFSNSYFSFSSAAGRVA